MVCITGIILEQNILNHPSVGEQQDESKHESRNLPSGTLELSHHRLVGEPIDQSGNFLHHGASEIETLI
jgi:hypothetical protein